MQIVGDLDPPTCADIVHPAFDRPGHDPGVLGDHDRDHAAARRLGGEQDGAGLDFGRLRQAEYQHHRTSQERQASDRGTEHDEVSNDGLHFLTC